jgi:uncharacterized protein
VPDSPAAYAILLAGAAAAGFAQGLSGFAFSMIALSVWAWAISPQVAAPLAVFGALMGQILSLVQLRAGYELRKILPLVIGGMVGVPIGVFALHNIDPTRFRLAVGTLLTIYGAYGLLSSGLWRFTKGGAVLDGLIGVVGGALGGLGGMSGTVPAIWTQARGWGRDLRRATMQVYNIAMHVTTLTVYAGTGGFKGVDLRLFAIAAPAMLIPAWFGARLYTAISERMFQRIVFVLLLLSGLALLYASARTLKLIG